MTPTAPWRPPYWTGPQSVASLTQRQADVLTGICEGMTNRQIARHHGISEDTVKTHVKAVLKALGVGDRTLAAIRAVTGQVVIHVRGDYEPIRRAA